MNKPRKTRSAKATTTPAPDATHPPQHILVVDDDPSLRQLGTEVLIRHGYQVDAAADSTTGWKLLQTHHYDLLITDLDMPKMSGLKLMKRLRAAHIALPVILASGTLTPGELNRTPWLHLSGALLKPVSTDQLLQTVQAVLGARGLIARPPAKLARRVIRLWLAALKRSERPATTWVWDAARGLDYLETDPTVSAKKVGIEGVSRYGKAALVTLAFEPRFALALVGSSGEGGAKLHRLVRAAAHVHQLRHPGEGRCELARSAGQLHGNRRSRPSLPPARCA